MKVFTTRLPGLGLFSIQEVARDSSRCSRCLGSDFFSNMSWCQWIPCSWKLEAGDAPPWTSEVDLSGTENGRSWSFEEHRRNHYDEFRKAKWLGGHSDGEEEDDSCGREGESRNAGTSSSVARSKMGSLSGSLPALYRLVGPSILTLHLTMRLATWIYKINPL